MNKHSVLNAIKRSFFSVWPALAVLFLSLIIAAFFAEFTFVAGVQSVWKILLAIQYIAQMIVVLYPPFLVMAFLHTLYIKKYEILILKRLKAAPQIVPIKDRE